MSCLRILLELIHNRYPFINTTTLIILFFFFIKKSIDNIYLYLGNVTELLLSGNAITSTRGLDRVFSLERLALDENKITQLTHIVGIAKLPFLMNLDMKGNPFEIDGTKFLD